jgi:uncharacterized RDD family membrane protein YckC
MGREGIDKLPEGFCPDVECPKCGFVSFPESARCERCGAPLTAAPPVHNADFLAPDSDAEGEVVEAAGDAAAWPERAVPPTIDQVPLIKNPAVNASSPQWRGDLADRVARFRHRRTRLRGFDSSGSLDFDFEARDADARVSEQQSPPNDEDLTPANGQILEMQPFEHDWEGAASEERAWSDGPGRRERPLEIVFESARPGAVEDDEPVGGEAGVAPLAARFMAGAVDALVLLAAAGLFALIFWIAGGRWSRQPATLAVTALVAALVLFGYVGLFTALVAATPGQRALGLAVRDFDEAPPTTRESLWRAFGYLVSASALGLGFIWALVDSDGLTWHDRISETCLVGARDARGAEER